MRILMHRHSLVVFVLLVVGGSLAFFLIDREAEVEQITATVERGDVLELVSVSGVVEAPQTAELAFPNTGAITTGVFVDEGDEVKAGDVLATLAAAELAAERSNTVSTLEKAQAIRDELVTGLRNEARVITETSVDIAEANLLRITREEEEKVINAREKMYSSGLSARSLKESEDATPPTISGTYTCDTEGTYILETYASGAFSGYSYQLSGLDEGTYSVPIEQPAPLGTCGLFIQFDPDSAYFFSEWIIEIPNTLSSTYLANKNAYEEAQTNRDSAIAAAQEALEQALEQATLDTANPRTEALVQADADVRGAQARIAVIDAQIANRSIVAPFDGVITDVSILPGEAAPTTPVVTLLASDTFELIARIPEIDVTKIHLKQRAEIIFDAQADEILTGSIDYLSPLATEIDGVAYFEARIILDTTPAWLRSGLNADIEIITSRKEEVLRLPKRFVTEEADGTHTILMPADVPQKKVIEVGVSGNDGFVEVIGLTEGQTVVAPQ